MPELTRWRPRQAAGAIRSLRDGLNQLPLGHRLNDIIDVAEEAVIERLRDRLNLAMAPAASAPAGREFDPQAQARQQMADLIDQANAQSAEDAQQHLYCLLLRQLVPDEVRILAALSDGQTHAMIHVAGGPPIGPVARRVLNNYSYVGRSASVRLEDMVPRYLAHMIQLGLVESGPEDKSLEVKYEVMSNDKTVRALGKIIEKDYRFPARILRRTVRATDLGRHLWHDCVPDGRSVEPVI